MTLLIRKATKNDVAELSSVCSQSFIETYNGKGKNRPKDMATEYAKAKFAPDKIEKDLSSESTEIWVATVKNNIAGYFKIVREVPPSIVKERNLLNLLEIYLLKKHQGQGIGKKLLNKACERASSLGFNGLWLGVWDENLEAIEFYRRQGFTAIGNIDWKFSYRDINYVDNDTVMIKVLTNKKCEQCPI